MYKSFYFLSRIYTFLIKGRFAHFGKHSIIKPFLNTANERYISIGDNVNVGAFCRITVSTEFGGHQVKSDNQIRLEIGDNVSIGNNSFVSANNRIRIGSHVIMSAYVFITDHDHGFQDFSKNLDEQPLSEGGAVVIGDNVFLGTKCSILKNITIGERAVISANAVVTKNVPAYSVVAGNPARIIKQFDFIKNTWVKAE